ncbi:hypothetical protein DYB37_007209 [Aphanomyces astaci]|uniref:Uncharacterized protein n=1 Tax=Aphanomyces astaci TaxID=112090 RepID=A0A397ATK2_APHAT|nr:hypothetical protein DYB36_009026 [Aphanomyces astaci]RHY82843.1 hypothetical protein DYB35_008544 [Aphanomyces astaci]RHZ18791.1 hypothetical protein DYB37_007209 [Aphanomyces astaci]RLO11912.1 hypothetical protein DYB28_009149 [Aphanomyces astaci]
MTPLDVIAKVMALYDTETPDVDAIIETFYHPNAVFSDPLVKDHWDLKSVLESVPLFSTLYPKVRYLLGYSSTKVINVLSPRALPPLPVELEAHQLEESKVDTV